MPSSTTLNIHEVQEHLTELVDRVSQGEEIILTRQGYPVARLSRYERPQPHPRLGLLEGQIQMADDFDTWPEDLAQNLGIID